MLYHLVRLAQRLSGALPRRLRWWFGELIAQAVYWCWAEKRVATRKNMSIVLGLPSAHPRVRRTARLSWRNYGRYIADFFDLPNHPSAFFIDHLHDLTTGATGALDTVDAVRATGKGGIIITGHYGTWDVAGILLGMRQPIHILVDDFADPRLNDLIQAQRKAANMIVLSASDVLRPLLRLLRQGEVVATPIDRPLGVGEGVPVRFFGRTAYIPRGLLAIAVKVGAAVVPGFAWYDGIYGYFGRIFPPIIIERTGNEDADIQRAAQTLFDAFEVMVRQDPTQWYMFRQFWPDDAEAAATTSGRDATALSAPGGSDT